MKLKHLITSTVLLLVTIAYAMSSSAMHNFLVENEIIKPSIKTIISSDDKGTISLYCSMGPYGGSYEHYQEASANDLKNNLVKFGYNLCHGNYQLTDVKTKVLTLNPGEYNRILSGELSCSNEKSTNIVVEPRKLCGSLLNFDDPQFLEQVAQ